MNNSPSKAEAYLNATMFFTALIIFGFELMIDPMAFITNLASLILLILIIAGSLWLLSPVIDFCKVLFAPEIKTLKQWFNSKFNNTDET